MTAPPSQAPTPDRPRVLHVAFRFGGGQMVAVGDYMANSPDLQHHALVERDARCDTGRDLRTAASLSDMPPGSWAKIKALRATVRDLDPAVIHAHSSFAGLLTRLALPRSRQRSIVYTPHCYAFFRQDISVMTRAVFTGVELVLARRRGLVAACSPQERDAATKLYRRSRVVYVPNVGHLNPDPSVLRQAASGGLTVVGAGRLTAQKGPELFAEAARLARARGLDLHWKWVGGGNAHYEQVLADAGVEVTGWLPADAAAAHVATAGVYVHSAAWEGAPFTVLEAAQAKVPVLARDTPALAALGVGPLWRTPAELVDLLAGGLESPALDRARESTLALNDRHTSASQQEALMTVYRAAMSESGRATVRLTPGVGPDRLWRPRRGTGPADRGTAAC